MGPSEPRARRGNHDDDVDDERTSDARGDRFLASPAGPCYLPVAGESPVQVPGVTPPAARIRRCLIE